MVVLAIFKTEERRNQAFIGQPVYIVPKKNQTKKQGGNNAKLFLSI